MSTRFFPYAVAVLDMGAVFVYARNGEWKLAGVWLCYAIASFLLGSVR